MDQATAIGQLRHLYEQMVNLKIKDSAGLARGLLGPAIESLERAQQAGGEREIAFATTAKTWDTKREGLETEVAALRSCITRAIAILERLAGGTVAKALAVLREHAR